MPVFVIVCWLSFADSLDPDPLKADKTLLLILDPNCVTLLRVPEIIFWSRQQKHEISTLDKQRICVKYAIKIIKKAIKMKCVRTEKQF